MAGSNARKRAAEHPEFACKDGFDHVLLRGIQYGGKITLFAAEIPVRRVKALEPPSIDEHMRKHVEPFVAGRAGDAREARHRLAVGQNFLDDDVESGRQSRLA